ncbi:uncharacterized protein LOC128883690 isoform X2 [Hylaeus volcanicus]|uniref:uncharacterized protein LOC128883690 isoform X2 n=1 Tax=Hylaeus volcanicus TaxID=313075 RepID=UPI0023B848D1|nr:uncharacterized protein LOC128883690 isoform X2 [Hylaeus volcanicus]
MDLFSLRAKMLFCVLPTLYFFNLFLADRVHSHVLYFQRDALLRLDSDSPRNDNLVSFPSPRYSVKKILILTKPNQSKPKNSKKEETYDRFNQDPDLKNDANNVSEEVWNHSDDVADENEEIRSAGAEPHHLRSNMDDEEDIQRAGVKPQHLRGKTSKVDEKNNNKKDSSEEVLEKKARAAQSRLAFSSNRGSNAGPGQFRGNCGMYQGIQGAVIPCIGDSLSASFALDPLRNSFTNHEPSPITRSDISFNENNMWDI